MTDPLDELKHAMDRATPMPDPARRAANLARAQELFERAQGLAAAPRPTHDRPTGWAGWKTGVGRMFAALAARPALAATTGLAALGLIVLVPLIREGSVPLLQPEDPLSGTMVAQDGISIGPAGGEVAEIAAAPATVQPPSAPAPVAAVGSPIDLAETESLDVAPSVRSLRSSTADPEAELALRTESIAEAQPTGHDGLGGPGSETFANADPQPLRIAAEEPVSTFAIDVDTASYAFIRSTLMHGFLPSPEAVRIEEMINYFPYEYSEPEASGSPFRPTVTVMETPWNRDTQLIHIALQGRSPAVENRPPLNLVFLVDTSGSMDDPAKLPLLVQSFRLMLGQLRPEDQIAIVAYAGSAGLVLGATPAGDRAAVLAALDQLHAGGSTAGAEGLRLAYRTAERMATEGEVTRVLLATDGDFNVGIADPDALEAFIARKRQSGIYLSVLGFGRGNLDDATMQALAQNGNGQAAYIDTLSEARKVLVDQLTGALFPIANDVKIQVEFNPAVVAEYRLIGYETRALAREDFNNDKVDAGEISAGHSVTALYEITPVGSPAVLSDPLRYAESREAMLDLDGELAYLRLRYKEPGEAESRLTEFPIALGTGAANADTRFAAAIAGFGQILRGGRYLGTWSYPDAITLAEANTGDDRYGYRREAVTMMRLAESLAD